MIGLLLALALFAGSIAAEPPPDGEAPGPSDATTAPADPDPQAEAAPAAAPEDSILVEQFRFVGNQSISSAELSLVVAPFLGKAYDLAGLEKVAEEVTKACRERGFTLATAYIQEQEIAGGVVEITIVEGRVGNIKVEGNHRYSEDFIRGHLDGLVEATFRQEELEDSLLILNDNPYLKVETTLQPGTAEGTTDILAKVAEEFPLHLNLHFDNFGSELISRHQFGAEIEWAPPLIDGAKFTLGGTAGEDPDLQANYRAGYSMPIGHAGTRIAWTGYTGNFTLGKELTILGIQGTSRGWGIAVTHPLIKHRGASLDLRIGYDNKFSQSFLLEEVSSHDEIRSVHLGADFLLSHDNGATFGSAYVYQGLGDFLGGTEQGDPEASRKTAWNEFTKFTVSLGRSQKVLDWFTLFLRSNAQFACDSLLAGEQMPVGGSASVRGYADGEISGDSGYVVSLESRFRPFPSSTVGFDLLAFGDYGARHLRKPTVDQHRWSQLAGWGLGARLDLSQLGLPGDASVRFDVAWPVHPKTNAEDRDPIFYLSTDLRF